MSHTLLILAIIAYGVFVYHIPWMLAIKRPKNESDLRIRYTIDRNLRKIDHL